MTIISRFKSAIDPPAATPAEPPRPALDRLLDRLITSTYLLPIGIIGGAIWYLGYNPLYIAALAAGCIVWTYWGRKMTTSDGKLALVINVEKGEIAPYIIGRSRWAAAKKEGRPFLNFRTPAGISVEVIQDYDPETNTVVYPPAGDYSDLYIASIPDRYGSLIDELVRLNAAVMTSESEIDLRSIKKARDHNTKLSQMVDDLLIPKGGNDGAA